MRVTGEWKISTSLNENLVFLNPGKLFDCSGEDPLQKFMLSLAHIQ